MDTTPNNQRRTSSSPKKSREETNSQGAFQVVHGEDQVPIMSDPKNENEQPVRSSQRLITFVNGIDSDSNTSDSDDDDNKDKVLKPLKANSTPLNISRKVFVDRVFSLLRMNNVQKLHNYIVKYKY